MNNIKLRFPKDYIIYHIIQRLIWWNWFDVKKREYFFINSNNNNWKLFLKYKYDFLSEWDKYIEKISYFDSEKLWKKYIIDENYEKDSEEIEHYIYRELEGQELINMIDFLYEEIFSLEILPWDPKYFWENYWGNNTALFHDIVGQIEYRKLKISEIDQLKEIIKKNYKRSKVSEDTYNEVLRKLDRKKVIAIKD